MVKPIYHLFYRLLPVRKVNSDNRLFLLTEAEIKIIRNKERIATWSAACFGGMGVLLLYVPQYVLPHWFPVTNISLFGKPFAVPVVMLVYSVILVIIEIMLLTFLNIWCTHEIAVATGFLNYQSKKEKEKRNLLINIGLEKKEQVGFKIWYRSIAGHQQKSFTGLELFCDFKSDAQ